MSEGKQTMTLDERLSSALETAPAITAPDDFALRVMQRLPASPARVGRIPVGAVASPGIGRRVVFAAVFALIVAMLGIALYAHGGVASTAVEWSLAAELIVLGVWMGLRPQWLR